MTPEMEFRISGRNRTQQAFDQVRADMRKTGDALGPIGQKIDMVTGKLGMLPTLLKATLVGAGVEAARQFAGAVGDANNAVAALYDQAKASNVSFEGFQALGYAAKQNRIEIDSLGQGLREMQDKAEEFATTGGGRAAEAFERLGYNAGSLKAALKDPIELFEDIIDKMGDLDKAAQIRLMGDIFGGGEGDQFLKLLDEGKAGLEQLQQTARDTGKVLGEDLGAAADETRRKFDEWAGAFDLWWKGIAVSVAQMATGTHPVSLKDSLQTEQDNYAARLANPTDFSLRTETANEAGKGVTRQDFEAFTGVKLTTPVDPMAGMFGRGGAKYTPAERLWERPSQGGSVKATTKEVEALDIGIQSLNQTVEKSNPLVDRWASTLSDLAMAALTGGDALGMLGSALLDAGKDFLDSGLNQLFSGLLGGTLFGGGGNGFMPATGYVPGFGAFGQFDTGGWTGGARGQPAGVVHGEEFVVKAGPAAANRGALEAMNAGLAVGGGGGVIVNNYGSPDSVRAETRPDGTVELFVNEAVRRVEGNMARGKYRSMGVSPGTRRS